MQITVKQGKSSEQHAQADEAVEECCTHGNDRQDIQWKHDLFDVIDVGKNQARGAVEYLSKQSMHDHADKQHNGKLGFAHFASNAPAGLEDHGEDEGVYGQHEHRVEEGPGQAQGSSFVAANYFALGHLHDELTVAPETFSQCHEGCGLGCVGVDRCLGVSHTKCSAFVNGLACVTKIIPYA